MENRQGEGKNSIGNVEAKELICTTNGHKLRVGRCWNKKDIEWSGVKGRKKWDNCNSIINKIYLKRKRMKQTKKEFFLSS